MANCFSVLAIFLILPFWDLLSRALNNAVAEPFLELLTKLSQRKIVQKEDIESFLLKYNNFKIKKFVDFFDEDVTRDEAINVDYIYLFSNIIKTFITNFNLQHKIEYQYQALNNGTPNVQIDTTDLYDNIKEES